MKIFSPPIDLSSADTSIYHMPGGPSLSVKIDSVIEYIDLDLELGYVCDTSKVNGVVHFLPRGNA